MKVTSMSDVLKAQNELETEWLSNAVQYIEYILSSPKSVKAGLIIGKNATERVEWKSLKFRIPNHGTEHDRTKLKTAYSDAGWTVNITTTNLPNIPETIIELIFS